VEPTVFIEQNRRPSHEGRWSSAIEERRVLMRMDEIGILFASNSAQSLNAADVNSVTAIEHFNRKALVTQFSPKSSQLIQASKGKSDSVFQITGKASG